MLMRQYVMIETFLQTDTLIKRIERKMFDEGNPVYLYIVDFGTELDTPGFLSTDDGTNIMLVDTDYPFLDLPVFKQLLLLDQNLFYDGDSTLIIRCMTQFGTMMLPYLVNLKKKLSLQMNQSSRT